MGFVSWRSLRHFFGINGVLMSLGGLQHASVAWMPVWPGWYATLLARNYLLLWGIARRVQERPWITEVDRAPARHLDVWKATAVETLSMWVFMKWVSPHVSMARDVWTFIPYSFVVEVLFDFFHYWTHRMAHRHRRLYAWVHGTHHHHPHPTVYTTYAMDAADILWSNTLPWMLALYLAPFSISVLQLHFMLVYKEFIEISGHCGKRLYPNGSFVQCIWWPRWWGIQLHSEDHHLHHVNPRVNFGKRFSLWDRVFGTYQAYLSKK